MDQVNIPAPEKLKVFISYSRRDSSDFAEELVEGLKLVGFEPKLDLHDIAKGEDWEVRLGAMIHEADSVVFVPTLTLCLLFTGTMADAETADLQVGGKVPFMARTMAASVYLVRGVTV